MNAANSLSFTVHKHRDNNELCNLWDKIVDFKTVWIPEFNEYFKITVSINETDDIVKTLLVQLYVSLSWRKLICTIWILIAMMILNIIIMKEHLFTILITLLSRFYIEFCQKFLIIKSST